MIIDSDDCLCKFQSENKSNIFEILKMIYELVIVIWLQQYLQKSHEF